MLKRYTWQSRTALLLSFGMMVNAIAPILPTQPATAADPPYRIGQLFPQSETPPANATPAPSRSTIIRADTVLPVQYDEAEKIVVTPDETIPLTVNINRNIRSRRGELLIPAGSQISGEIRPAAGGSQFVAEELLIRDGRRAPIDAISDIATERETIRKGADTGTILKGAAIGGAAAALLFALTGNRKIEAIEIIGGAGAGALGGVLLGRKKVDVIIIRPERDLSSLTLRQPLEVPPDKAF